MSVEPEINTNSPMISIRRNDFTAEINSGADETAKENNLDPYKYLTYIFSKAPNLKENETIDILLPWNAPDDCQSKVAHSNE